MAPRTIPTAPTTKAFVAVWTRSIVPSLDGGGGIEQSVAVGTDTSSRMSAKARLLHRENPWCYTRQALQTQGTTGTWARAHVLFRWGGVRWTWRAWSGR
jgi:hypothetical protein